MTPLDIACDPPPILPRPSPAVASLMWRAFGCALAGALVLGFFAAPRETRCCLCHPKLDNAKLTIARFTNEAYPAWRRANPGRRCPFGLGELTPYLKEGGVRDPWGRLYQFTCGDDRIYVMSLGADKLLGTDDDLWSSAGDRR
jgi:hypothetical protein